MITDNSINLKPEVFVISSPDITAIQMSALSETNSDEDFIFLGTSAFFKNYTGVELQNIIWQAAIILTFRKIKDAGSWDVEMADPKDVIELVAKLVGEQNTSGAILTGVLVMCRGVATKIITVLQNQVKKHYKVTDLQKVNLHTMTESKICDIAMLKVDDDQSLLFDDIDEIELEPIPLEQPQVDEDAWLR